MHHLKLIDRPPLLILPFLLVSLYDKTEIAESDLTMFELLLFLIPLFRMNFMCISLPFIDDQVEKLEYLLHWQPVIYNMYVVFDSIIWIK